MRRRSRRAKILATLGPASADRAAIAALYRAGADAFRLNFSHGSHEQIQALYDIIREVEESALHPIAVVADLQGPKLRVGELASGTVSLREGQAFRLDQGRAKGDESRAPLPHKAVYGALNVGMDILLDDGRIHLRVTACGEDFAETEVVTGGALSDHKGVNLPGAVLPLKALTDKDRRDLAFAVNLGVDWLALSFVQRPEDVAEARILAGPDVAIMAKIEKPSAVKRFDEILELADGIMVARGDLGVELAPEAVPAVQKQIVRAARDAGKPVVVATQMLESMIRAPAPTRAEASDVATAVYDGGDALMLSAETAVGDYAAETVDMMHRIIDRVEHDPLHRQFLEAAHTLPTATAADAISAAARQVAETLRASAIVTYTGTGSTALRAARERPVVPILVLTPKLDTARRLAVVWGVHCVQTEDTTNFTDMVERAGRIALR
ncbi:MAG: pyruvate kinase, partial [Alphaproteobacteria bacterium]|nr:pyruvate kinase [Alphaproteobacteria bacterium]